MSKEYMIDLKCDTCGAIYQDYTSESFRINEHVKWPSAHCGHDIFVITHRRRQNLPTGEQLGFDHPMIRSLERAIPNMLRRMWANQNKPPQMRCDKHGAETFSAYNNDQYVCEQCEEAEKK